MTTSKTVTEARVTWQADHEQYWQGHGVAFSKFDECATGVGDTLREAFDDALEMLAQNDVALTNVQELELLTSLTNTCNGNYSDPLNVTIVEACCDAEGEHLVTSDEDETAEDEDPDCAVCAGEWHFYVSIDVKFAEEK